MYYRELDMTRMFHHHLCLEILVGLIEIGCKSLANIFRLAYIEVGVLFPNEPVYAWFIGIGRGEKLKVISSHSVKLRFTDGQAVICQQSFSLLRCNHLLEACTDRYQQEFVMR